MKVLIRSMALLIALYVLSGYALASDLGNADVPVIVRIPQMIVMTLDANELVFEESDFDYHLGPARLVKSGVVATKNQAVTASISGNVPYSLLVSSSDEYLTGSDGGLIHISQLRWRLADEEVQEDNWQPITIERTPVTGGPPGTLTVEFDFQLIALWENPAQTYRGVILLTVIPDSHD